MTKLLRTAIFFFSLVGLMVTNSFAGMPVNSLAPMLQKVLPAVVNIKAQIINTPGSRLESKQQEENNNNNAPAGADKMLSIGSGVIVDANKGYVLTNSHVVEDTQSIIVTLSDGRHFNAKLIGLDKPSDIAVLQIQAKNLAAIPISDSNQLKVGDVVAAIGNPFGLSQSVTSGIVSALGRTTLGIENFENFIQTDAPINPGNSGGALINSEGQLVGVNTAILAPNRGSIGIGFAIPSNMAKSIMQQLIEFGNVRRGALGIAAQDMTPELASAFNQNISKGAVVTMVVPNSPAQKAGLHVGDIITSVNGAEVKNANDVVNSIGILRVDSKASIVVQRDNKSVTLTTNISDPKKRQEINEQDNPFLYGVGLKNFTLLSPVHGDVNGILVVTVEEDSNAWQAGLMPGDVITSANQTKVANIADLQKIAGSAKSALLLNVLRDSAALFLVINKA